MTIKVKPWGDGQGDFVLIDEDQFDPLFHVLIDDAAEEPKKRGRKPKAVEDGVAQPAD